MYTLVIGRSFPTEETGMMGIFEFEQASALKKNGMDTVYMFCDTRSVKALRKLNYQQFVNESVPVYGYHFPIGGIPRKLFDKLKTQRYKKILKAIFKKHGKPSFIHVHFPLLTLTNEMWEILKDIQVPIIITEHWSKVQQKIIEPFRINLLQKIVEESHAFICVSDLLKQSVIELTNTSKEILVIPNMLNKHFYYKEQIKNKNDFNFIAIGRIVEVKRFVLTVEAFAKAFPNEKNIKLHIVGDGPLYNKVQEKIKELKMEERIIMHGFLPREKTADLLRESDVFVSASVLETFGVPFIEAMACGKPVIGVINGPIDLHIKQNNGLLFERDNIKDLKEKKKSIYKDINKFDEQIISNYAINNFSDVAIVNELKKIYTSIE